MRTKTNGPIQAEDLTPKQRELLYYLFTFRFLTIFHLKQLFTHKDPRRIRDWLTDLMALDVIRKKTDRKSLINYNVTAVYYLAPKARYILKQVNDTPVTDLNYLFKESLRSDRFIHHSLFIADVYLYLNSQKTDQEEIKFFTKTLLHTYDYLPRPLPDAFIGIVTKDTTTRYFLDQFDSDTPPFVMRWRIKQYITYRENSAWHEITHTDFPTLLFILPNQQTKKHVLRYTAALLRKREEADLKIFLTTKQTIQENQGTEIWQKVE